MSREELYMFGSTREVAQSSEKEIDVSESLKWLFFLCFHVKIGVRDHAGFV